MDTRKGNFDLVGNLTESFFLFPLNMFSICNFELCILIIVYWPI